MPARRRQLEAPGEHLAFEARDAGAMVAPAGISPQPPASARPTRSAASGKLARLRDLVRPGGYLVIGEGYWEQEPGEELLDLLGAARDELTTLPELLDAGAGHNLELVYAATATKADWRRYEWAYVFNLDRYIRDHPGEEGLAQLHERRDRIRRRRLLAAREGETLGFALVAWRNPWGSSTRSSRPGRGLSGLGRRGGAAPMLVASVRCRRGEARFSGEPAPPASPRTARPRPVRSCIRQREIVELLI